MNNQLPLVSVGIAIWNGDNYLEATLQSLMEQEYKNLEIIILDNQSTDRTSEICKAATIKDHRIRYILDEKMRDVMSAQSYVASIAKGEFYMVACDDDWYEPGYIDTLMNVFMGHPEVGLAYTDYGFMDSSGARSNPPPIQLFNASSLPSENLRLYFSKRDPVPMIFGLVRIELHLDALAYYKRPDNRGWNHDNLYLMRLLSKSRVEGVSRKLFFYRQQDRKVLYKKRKQYYEPNNPINRYWNHILHQWSVKGAVDKIIDDSIFSEEVKKNLKKSNLLAFFAYVNFKYLREFIKDSLSSWSRRVISNFIGV